MASELVLIVDDEPNIVQLARMYLEREGFKVESAGDGRSGLEKVSRLRPAFLVLDIMLPLMDGIEVCRRLRAENNPIPILILTARDDDVDKILGLEMGADDYLTKPFNPRELTARVKAILRRGGRSASTDIQKPIHIADLVIDPSRREVHLNGRPVELRHQEFNLLLVLAENQEMVLSREKLLNLAWGFDYAGETRTVDVHIGHLRKKLTGSAVRIETVTSDGYKLVG
jgi:two-component system alkaline phosphatase synthesis response regulator PhoP